MFLFVIGLSGEPVGVILADLGAPWRTRESEYCIDGGHDAEALLLRAVLFSVSLVGLCENAAVGGAYNLVFVFRTYIPFLNKVYLALSPLSRILYLVFGISSYKCFTFLVFPLNLAIVFNILLQLLGPALDDI